MNLMERINWNKEARKNIQTVGIIHEGIFLNLIFARIYQVLIADQ